MSRKVYLTTAEAIADVEELSDVDDNQIDVVIAPPETSVVSDEEGLDENDLAENELSLPDAAGMIEVHQTISEKIVDRPQSSSQPASKRSKSNTKSRRAKSKNSTKRWSDKRPAFTSSPVSKEAEELEIMELELAGKSPTEIFEFLFDEEVFNLLVEQSILYAKQNNRHDFSCTIADMKTFVGFLLFTGYHKLPREDMYWSLDPDCNTTIVRNSLCRKQFRDMKKNLHLKDNSELDTNDKLSKVRPYLNLLNSKYKQFGVFHFNLSIDEQMIPYRGRHSAKMFIQGKPIRFGYKAWTLASSTGYIYTFDIYAGKSNSDQASESTGTLGLGGKVVVDLLHNVDSDYHAVYFDNFFTSFDLLTHLKKNGYFACGTMRENRTGNCPLQDKKAVEKKARGWYEYKFEEEHEVCITRWNDNKAVTVGSNFTGVEPVGNVSRFSRSERKDVLVKQPKLITDYNKFMGGVDLADNMVSNYRIRVRSKKWWWPIFSNYVDVSMVNAWRLWQCAHPQESMQLLDFRRQVTVNLLQTKKEVGSKATATGRPSRFSIQASIPTASTSTHFLTKFPNNQRRRCRECHSQTRFTCELCVVALHQKCTVAFHTKSK